MATRPPFGLLKPGVDPPPLHDCPGCKGSGEGAHGECRLCEGARRLPADTLLLDPFEHWLCTLHAEPFRERWPKGMAAIVLMVIEEVLQDPELWATADAIVAARPELSKPFEGVREALADVPACCRVPPERLLRLYVESGIGRSWRCKACRRWGRGTKLRNADPRTLEVSIVRHVCFRCVVYRARNVRET